VFDVDGAALRLVVVVVEGGEFPEAGAGVGGGEYQGPVAGFDGLGEPGDLGGGEEPHLGALGLGEVDAPAGGTVQQSGVDGGSQSAGEQIVATGTPNSRATSSTLSSLLLLLPPQQAAADAFNAGPPNGGYEADSANHLYCYGAGFDTGLRDDADYIMQSALDTETGMSDTFESSCNSGTDVEFLDANLPPGARGSYVCTSLSYVCWASEVTVDPAEINIGSNDTEDLRKTLCHEVGHSVGLLHGATDDCMLSGEIPNTNVQYRRYNYHHRWDHINVEY
jgi:hypothetical protein